MRAKSKTRKYDKSTAICRVCGTCGDLKAVPHTHRLRSLEDSCFTSSRHVLLAADMPEDPRKTDMCGSTDTAHIADE
jgi:hypothetical protein